MPRMRLRPFVLALMVVATAGSWDATVARAGSGPGRFAELEACATSHFSRQAGRCAANEAKAPIASNGITCSVAVVVTRPAVFRGKLLFDGQLEWASPRYPVGPGSFPWNMYASVPRAGLPAGTWQCIFSLGDSVTGSLRFQTIGPSGSVVSPAVCVTSDIVHSLCRRDSSGTPFSRAVSVGCSGLFVGQRGKRLEIFFTLNGTVEGVQVNLRAEHALQALDYLTYPPPTLAPRGIYECQYLVDHKLVVTKRFTYRRRA